MVKEPFHLLVNGRSEAVVVSGDTPLLYVLRNDLGLKGTRFGCGTGDCGACMILLDGVAEKSCQLPLESIGARMIETVEGLGSDELSSRLLQSMQDEQAGQCGYCLSGIVMTAAALLRACPSPSETDVCQALNGNLCRCGSHARIIAAVLGAAAQSEAT